jgi:hypothetical protein
MVALAAIGADQPGMGMTNRVLPAQGEERGATYTLIRLDGDACGKFQSFESGFFLPQSHCQLHFHQWLDFAPKFA